VPEHIRAALDGHASLSDELSAPGGKGPMIEWALPFKTPFGRRVEVPALDSSLILTFLSGSLASEPTSKLYPVLAGSRNWFLFAVLGAFALAGARYLQKPYAMEDLARAVRNLVGSPGPLVIGPAAR
jgi:hypothetical protein